MDIELEKRNFFKAAEVLAEIWLNTVIDGHKVETKALPVGLEYELEAVDAEWARTHVQQSRYSIQIIKCTDSNCCTNF